MTTTTTSPARTTGPAPGRVGRDRLALRLPAAALALAVSAIHVVDQGGLTALKHPAYVGQGYRLLELGGLLVAALLLLAPARARLAGWVLALGVAVGPVLGFVLSRGPGLPGYVDDRGNWTELLGLQALTVEALLLGLALAVVVPVYATTRRGA